MKRMQSDAVGRSLTAELEPHHCPRHKIKLPLETISNRGVPDIYGALAMRFYAFMKHSWC
jgi:hypothetical protein